MIKRSTEASVVFVFQLTLVLVLVRRPVLWGIRRVIRQSSSTEATMRCQFFLVVVMSAFGQASFAYAEAPEDFRNCVTEMIAQIEAQMANASAEEKPAFAAAIDSLVRLRDRDASPVVNSPIAITTLQNTSWRAAPDENGFRQTLTFGGQGGQWHANPNAHPYGFNWLIESDRLRLSHLAPYKDPFNYQIVDRTYTYSLADDTLTMTRGDEVLSWRRAPD